jgi:hypothetical protein
MSSFYVVSNGEKYSFGITDLSFEKFSVGKIVLLFLPCYNHREVLEEISKINAMDSSGNEGGPGGNEGTQMINCDLKKLLRLCIKKIQYIQPEHVSQDISSNIIDLSENLIFIDGSSSSLQVTTVSTPYLSENLIFIDGSSSSLQVTTVSTPLVEDDRMKMFENLNLKIFAETTNVNHILTRVQTFKSNVSKINQTLDSLRRFKAVTGLTQTVQSERPRGPARVPQAPVTQAPITNGPPVPAVPEVQATPRGGMDVLTIDECKTWMKNKSVNPRTGRTIDVNGPTYRRIQAMAKMYRLIG